MNADESAVCKVSCLLQLYTYHAVCVRISRARAIILNRIRWIRIPEARGGKSEDAKRKKKRREERQNFVQRRLHVVRDVVIYQKLFPVRTCFISGGRSRAKVHQARG